MPNSLPDASSAPRYLAYPYAVSGAGTLNTTDAEGHLRDLILQVLLTNPGERVNLPEFGAGVQRLLFAPSNAALGVSLQFYITHSLQQWLGDRLTVEQVRVQTTPGVEETVSVEIIYTVRATRQRQVLQVDL